MSDTDSLFTIEPSQPSQPSQPSVVFVQPSQQQQPSSFLKHDESNIWWKILLLLVVLTMISIIIAYFVNSGVRERIDKWFGHSPSSSPSSPSPSPSPSSRTPVDCVVKWGNWSTCSALCGTNGTVSRTATVVTQPSNGGLACPPLVQTQPCNPLPPTCDKICCNDQGLQVTSTANPNCASCYSSSSSPSSPPSPSSSEDCASCPAKNCAHTCSCNLNFSGGSCQVSLPKPASTSTTFYNVPGW
jgi:hypothetical protein